MPSEKADSSPSNVPVTPDVPDVPAASATADVPSTPDFPHGLTIADLLDERGFIARDLTCKACGYNLRGLDPAVQCPECGRPVRESTDELCLYFTSPEWLWTLASGAWMLLIGLLLCAGGTAVIFALGFVIKAELLAADAVASMLLFLASSLLWLACLAITVVGMFRLTAPEPGSTPADEERLRRRRLRGYTVLWSAGLVVVRLAFTNWWTRYYSPEMPATVGAAVVALCLLPVIPLLARHLELLLHRARNADGARGAEWLWRASTITGSAVGIGALLAMLRSTGLCQGLTAIDVPLDIFMVACIGLGGVAELFMVFLSAFLLHTSARTFRSVAQSLEKPGRSSLAAPPVGE